MVCLITQLNDGKYINLITFAKWTMLIQIYILPPTISIKTNLYAVLFKTHGYVFNQLLFMHKRLLKHALYHTCDLNKRLLQINKFEKKQLKCKITIEKMYFIYCKLKRPIFAIYTVMAQIST